VAEIDWDTCGGTAGYWVAAPARRRGIAAHAVVPLCKWSFSLPSLFQLVVQVRVGNVASGRFAEEAEIPYSALLVDSYHEADLDRPLDVKDWGQTTGRRPVTDSQSKCRRLPARGSQGRPL
jgi:hypothetical protein